VNEIVDTPRSPDRQRSSESLRDSPAPGRAPVAAEAETSLAASASMAPPNRSKSPITADRSACRSTPPSKRKRPDIRRRPRHRFNAGPRPRMRVRAVPAVTLGVARSSYLVLSRRRWTAGLRQSQDLSGSYLHPRWPGRRWQAAPVWHRTSAPGPMTVSPFDRDLSERNRPLVAGQSLIGPRLCESSSRSAIKQAGSPAAVRPIQVG
jgi:hypothetical protein